MSEGGPANAGSDGANRANGDESPAPRYAELHCASHFSFLRGASSCKELFATAAARGIEALAITDCNSLAGIVRAHDAAKETGVRLIVGCELVLRRGADAHAREGATVLVYPEGRAGYGRLCRLLTLGKRRAGKGACDLGWDDLAAHAEGLLAILVPDEADARLAADLRQMGDRFGDRARLTLTLRHRPRDQLRLHQLTALSARAAVVTVVTGSVLYHNPSRRVLQDVVTFIAAPISPPCTAITRKGIRRMSDPSTAARSSVSRAGTWDRQWTQTMSAHCVSATRAKNRAGRP